MRVVSKPQVVTKATDVQCYGCGWKGMLGQCKEAVWIDNRPGHMIPAHKGGNGKTYRCPHCKNLIFYTGYDAQRKIIAPAGHQYREVV